MSDVTDFFLHILSQENGEGFKSSAVICLIVKFDQITNFCSVCCFILWGVVWDVICG